jgi:hypothetical protein
VWEALWGSTPMATGILGTFLEADR